MRAMILAAGLGTRLRPLTYVRPKALVPVLGSRVLDFWLDRLQRMGFGGLVINAYHQPEKILEAVGARGFEIPVQVAVEQELLGTGGGIRNVLDFFAGEPFVVVNSDIVSDASLGDLAQQFVGQDSEVALLLHDYPVFNNVAVDEAGNILGFGEEARSLARHSPAIRLMAFTGVHFLHPQVLRHLAIGEPSDILTLYRQRIAAGRPPRAMFVTDLFWREMGSIDAYWALHREMATYPAGFLTPFETGQSYWRHPQAVLSPDTRLSGVVMLGAGSRVMRGCQLEDVILWDNVTVESGTILRNCLVTDGMICSGRHENQILLREDR
jgi:mannose-1-phosphate guanylyltransferase